MSQHFDEISQTYHEEVSAAVRDHLINKWWGLVAPYFPAGGRVLDIGCGEGANTRFLIAKGLEAKGVDASRGLIEAGIARHPTLADKIEVGDALALPFADNAFDVSILIGVLHHIYSRPDQIRAIQEALRVTRVGGMVLIRESNLINPLFRLYWNYVFPLTARIDKFGGEHWIPAKYLQAQFSGNVESLHFFTFIPSFTPSFALPLATKVEGALERSLLRRLSAHYTIALRRT